MNSIDKVHPPNVQVSPPVFDLPPKATDCHAHVFESRFSLCADRSYTPAEASIRQYLDMLETIGFDRAVLIQPSVYGTDNTSILTCMNENDSSIEFRGVAVVRSDISDQELACLHQSGIRGVRMNLLFRGGISRSDIDALAPRLANFGWHVQLLVDLSAFDDFPDFVQSLPTSVVIDHMGYLPATGGVKQPGLLSLLDVLDRGKTWVKVSGAYRVSGEKKPPYTDVSAIAKTLLRHAPERMLYGTDWPHPAINCPMPNDTDLLNTFALWVDDHKTIESVLVANPEELYGFGTRCNNSRILSN